MDKNFIRKGFFILAACSAISASSLHAQQSQSIIETSIANESLYHSAASYTLFEKESFRDAQVDREIKDVIYLKLNKDVLQQVLQQKDPLLSISLPMLASGKVEHFTLSNFNIFDDNFKVYEVGSDGLKKEAQVDLGIFYRGILDGNSKSIAAFSFTKNQMVAVFSTVNDGNYNLVLNAHNPGINKDHYILFKESDIKYGHRPACAVSDTKNIKTEGNTAAKGTFNSCHKLRISMHGDYRLYQKVGNSLTDATDYLTALFNVDAALFNNEGINTVLSEVVVNSTPDGYTFSGSDAVLFRFGEKVHTSYVGDITQMVTGYHQNGFPPLGGLAWLDVVCQDPLIINQGGNDIWYGPFSMVDNYILDSIPQVPIYSWDAEASTHEMGHNIGSPHTQSCSWPGGPIDDCYPQEGSCSAGPHPAVNTGTIMSYCHLDASVGINFVYGFGPLPGALIRESIASKPCLTSFNPENTITTANKVRIANRQCTDGNWTYFYYDNNTASETDDELLLMLNADGQDIGNVDVTGMEVKMTTSSGYGSNTGRTVTAPYAINSWKEINRTWAVNLPATTSQPTSNVLVRFPYTNQDASDIQGSFASATDTGLSMIVFKNQNALNNPNGALTSDVNYYTNTNGVSSTTKWKKGTEGNYNYAEFVTDFGIFGGSMGFANKPTGIEKIKADNDLFVYPNPATSELNITMPQQLKGNTVFTIIDNLGRVTQVTASTKSNTGNVSINIAGLSAGVYCLRMINNGNHYNGYFVKH